MIPIAKPVIRGEEKKAVADVLNSGMLAQGHKVKEFEEMFAKYCGTKYAVALNSGTAALHTALYAMGIKKGDEVITTPFTFVATANCIIMQNAKPVFVDIKPDTFNIDPDKIQEKITKNTKAIIGVHLYGQMCDVSAIKDICEDKNLFFVEDACQAVGAEFNGIKAGSAGDIAAFSFYATKNMITGEGGMITTNNEKYAEFAKRFRHHGQSEKTRYEYYDLGYNYRMTDIQASIGLVQLSRIEELTKKRICNAKKLSSELSKLNRIEVPFIKKGAKHVFHLYTIKVDGGERGKNIEELKSKGVGCGIYYPKPLHMHPFFSRMDYKKGDFPVAENISRRVISLPVHPLLSEEEINKIIQVCEGVFKC